ncbi:MAG: shikimate dehydrogenase [Kiritimatiellia bacterium]
MPISAKTKTFAVLGHPIGHTLSPIMHNASFKALGLDALYLAFDMPPEHLMDAVRTMGRLGFAGINLTVPLKEVAFRGVDVLDESARVTGSVNTVQFLPEGKLCGYSTDGDGFLMAIEEAFEIHPKGMRIFICGCGGAGRAVAITCGLAGAREIVLADLDANRLANLQTELTSLSPETGITLAGNDPSEWAHYTRHTDLVVQASPVGMKVADPSPLPPEAFRPGQFVFDMIYMYPETAVMHAAAPAGAHTVNGLGMLLHQGAKSFEIWTGQKANIEAMRAALEQAVYPTIGH